MKQRLSFRGRHRYPDGFLLDAEFSFEEGVAALNGPSGSGKSTILSIIAGILRPDAGQVRLDSQVLLDTAARIDVPPEDRRVGMAFQDHLLFPHLTVEKNLRFGLKRRPARRVDFKRVVEVLELGPLLERSPPTLSGGERQRVALGRALLRGPELLLLDEPLGALDPALKQRILEYLATSLKEWGIPTLVVTHDLADARRIAERIIRIEGGKVLGNGDSH